MEKDMNGKNEIKIEDKDSKQLSDEELECANGGVRASTYHMRWVCSDCGATSDWDCNTRLMQYQENFHYNQTGHYNFKIESKYCADPNET